MKQDDIDNGSKFDFGKTALDYSKYRDIYPDSMYEKLYNLGIGSNNQNILDLGTGTGVFPRGMYKYGANFTGIDVSEEQIKFAKKLSADNDMNIAYKACPAEYTGLNSNEYDIITSVQSFIYFDREKIFPEITRLLKNDGKLVLIWMSWLPSESRITEETIKLVLKYNPKWTGAGYKPEKDDNLFTVPSDIFDTEQIINYTENIKFNYETWAGRIRACRGVSASLSEDIVSVFNNEHLKLLKKITNEPFEIMHEIEIRIYKMKL